jgi:hypothetical protein
MVYIMCRRSGMDEETRPKFGKYEKTITRFVVVCRHLDCIKIVLATRVCGGAILYTYRVYYCRRARCGRHHVINVGMLVVKPRRSWPSEDRCSITLISSSRLCSGAIPAA